MTGMSGVDIQSTATYTHTGMRLGRYSVKSIHIQPERRKYAVIE